MSALRIRQRKELVEPLCFPQWVDKPSSALPLAKDSGCVSRYPKRCARTTHTDAVMSAVHNCVFYGTTLAQHRVFAVIRTLQHIPRLSNRCVGQTLYLSISRPKQNPHQCLNQSIVGTVTAKAGFCRSEIVSGESFLLLSFLR